MERTVDKRVYSCWIVVEPADDMAGTWVSHCLNFDVVSFGDSPKDAVDSVCLAVGEVVSDDLQHQRDPALRGTTTPSESWTRLKEILASGKEVKLSEVASDAKVYLAKQMNFTVTTVTVTVPAANEAPVIEPMFLPTPTIGSIQAHAA